jgi:hypothetical protein
MSIEVSVMTRQLVVHPTMIRPGPGRTTPLSTAVRGSRQVNPHAIACGIAAWVVRRRLPILFALAVLAGFAWGAFV